MGHGGQSPRAGAPNARAFSTRPTSSSFNERSAAALQGVQIYGDGATVTQAFIRKRGKALISHSPVRTQLTWCQQEDVLYAIITHRGSEIVTGGEPKISECTARWGMSAGSTHDSHTME